MKTLIENLKAVSAGTWSRTVALVVVLVNQLLVMAGVMDGLMDESEVYTMVSTILTTLVSLWTAWKNNSFTAKAIKADKTLSRLKDGE